MARLAWNGGVAIRKLEKETPGIIERIAKIIAATARQLVPVKTRRLKKSIRAGKKGVNVDATYASYVEYGTPKAAAQPFLRPAIQMVKKSGILESLKGIKAFRKKPRKRRVVKR